MLSSLEQVPITIYQYDSDDILIGKHTGCFKEVFDSIKHFEKYYYRIAALNTNTLRTIVKEQYFGVTVSCLGGLNFTVQDYLNNYLNRIVQNYYKYGDCAKNNWEYNFWFIVNHFLWAEWLKMNIAQNTSKEFNAFLSGVLKQNPNFYEIHDLKEVHKKSGLYLMVLDNYNLCYIGQATQSIKRRIMTHWSRNDYFTGTGIDLFRAKDTTRIFVALYDSVKEINKAEHQILENVRPRYMLNIMSGGNLDYLLENDYSIVLSEEKDDDFIDYEMEFIDEEEVKKIQGKFIVANDK